MAPITDAVIIQLAKGNSVIPEERPLKIKANDFL